MEIGFALSMEIGFASESSSKSSKHQHKERQIAQPIFNLLQNLRGAQGTNGHDGFTAHVSATRQSKVALLSASSVILVAKRLTLLQSASSVCLFRPPLQSAFSDCLFSLLQRPRQASKARQVTSALRLVVSCII